MGVTARNATPSDESDKASSYTAPPTHSPELLQQALPLLAAGPIAHVGVELNSSDLAVLLDGFLVRDPGQGSLAVLGAQHGGSLLLQRQNGSTSRGAQHVSTAK